MQTARHFNPSPEVPADKVEIFGIFHICTKCGELQLFAQTGEGVLAVFCGCTADPSGPAIASKRPSPQTPLLEAVAA